MKDNQIKKLTRVVGKLAAEVAALRKLVRRRLRTKDQVKKGSKGKKRRATKTRSRTDTTPTPAA